MIFKNKHVLMICDDTIIDRRILQQSQTLINNGCKVTIIAKANNQFDQKEENGDLIIHRISNCDPFVSFLAKLSFETFNEFVNDFNTKISLEQAHILFNNFVDRLLLNRKYQLLMPQKFMKYGKLKRHLIWSLLCPPHRLVLLAKIFPTMPRFVRIVFYLITLLFTPWPSAIKYHLSQLHNNFINQKKQYRVITNRINLQDFNDWEISLFLKIVTLNFDCIQAHDLPQLRVAVFLSKIFSKPLIYDAHEIYPSIKTLSKSQQNELSAIEKYYIQFVDYAFTVNPFIAELMNKRYGISPEVLLNAYSIPDNYDPTQHHNFIREKLKLNNSIKLCIYHGWISNSRADFITLISAFKYVDKSIHLILMGYGDEINQIMNYVHNIDLDERIHYLPAVKQSDLASWLSSADVGLIPYLNLCENTLYSSPNKLYEFMALNIPIIANDLPYLKSIISTYKIGYLCDFTDQFSISNCINQLLKPNMKRFNYIKNKYSQLSDHFFLWESQEKIIINAFKQILLKNTISPHCSSDFDEIKLNCKPRILHAPYNISGMPFLLASAERKLGYRSISACFPSNTFQYKTDILLSDITEFKQLANQFRNFIEIADVFVFYFGTSFLGESLADVQLLKRLGKKIIFYFCGCDIRDQNLVKSKYNINACSYCNPPLCSQNRTIATANALLFSDDIWVSTPDLIEFIPKSKLMPQAIDINNFHFRKPSSVNNSSIRIIHSPSSLNIKGTKYIIEALKHNKINGKSIELVLLHNVSHDEISMISKSCDIAIDQLLIGSYGSYAAEMMATGLPTLCYIRDDLQKIYPHSLPLISTDYKRLKYSIAHLIDRKAEWDTIAENGLNYVNNYHSPLEIAKKTVKIYESLFY